jgi:hypothetical protein
MLWKFTILPIVAFAHWLFRNWFCFSGFTGANKVSLGFSSNGLFAIIAVVSSIGFRIMGWFVFYRIRIWSFFAIIAVLAA